jgi:hypothetical protein
MIDEGDCGAIGGMKIGRGNRSTRRKPAPAPLCPPQIPHDLLHEVTYAINIRQILASKLADYGPDDWGSFLGKTRYFIFTTNLIWLTWVKTLTFGFFVGLGVTSANVINLTMPLLPRHCFIFHNVALIRSCMQTTLEYLLSLSRKILGSFAMTVTVAFVNNKPHTSAFPYSWSYDTYGTEGRTICRVVMQMPSFAKIHRFT